MTSDRVVALDGLRGFALFLVLVFHSFLPQGFFQIPYSALFSWTWVGLDIFFVLSGYLITSILLHSLGKPGYFANFYLRRVFRIFPAYFATLLLVFAIFPFLSSDFAHSPTRDTFWLYALYIQNWVFGVQGWPDWSGIAHLWSMAVEEQYYMVWPLLITLVGRNRVPHLCVVVFVTAVTAKLGLTATGYFGISYTSTLTRMDGIAAGSFLATMKPEDMRRYSRLLATMAAAGLAMLLSIIVLDRGMRIEFCIGTSATVLLATAAVACVHGNLLSPQLQNVLSLRPMVWLGVRSYSIYLMHYPFQHVIWERIGPDVRAAVAAEPIFTPLLFSVISIAMFYAMGMPLYYLVEAPAMRLRDRMQASKRKRAAELQRAQ